MMSVDAMIRVFSSGLLMGFLGEFSKKIVVVVTVVVIAVAVVVVVVVVVVDIIVNGWL